MTKALELTEQAEACGKEIAEADLEAAQEQIRALELQRDAATAAQQELATEFAIFKATAMVCGAGGKLKGPGGGGGGRGLEPPKN